MSKREVCVSLAEYETRVQRTILPKRKVHVPLAERETRVQAKVALTHGLRVSLQKREALVQPQMAKNRTELTSPHPYGFEDSLRISLQRI